MTPPVRPDRRHRGPGWPAGDRRPSLRRRPRRRARRRPRARSARGRCCSTAGAVGRDDTLRGAGVVNGSRLDAVAPAESDPSPAPRRGRRRRPLPSSPSIVEAGPGGRRRRAPPAGRHVVGRSPSAAVALADGALEPHHALLDVDADGTVRFVQLTGRVPAGSTASRSPRRLPSPTAACSCSGASRLRVGRDVGPGRRVGGAHGDAGRPVAADAAAHAAATPALGADADRRAGSGRPGGASERRRPARPRRRRLLGSAGVAVVMRSPMFLLFGAVGVARLGRHVARRPDRRRPRRPPGAAPAATRDVAAFVAAVEEQRAARWLHHLAVNPGVAAAVSAGVHACAATCGPGGRPRRRLPRHARAGVRSTGTSSSTRPAAPLPSGAGRRRRRRRALRRRRRAGRPRSGRGAGGRRHRRAARSFVRSIVQLATWVGPADWRLVVVADDPAALGLVPWLPHAAGGGRHVVAADDADVLAAALVARRTTTSRHVVVVTDRPDLLAQRTGPLRRFLGAAPSVAVLVALPPARPSPAMCRSVSRSAPSGSPGGGPTLRPPTRPRPVHAAGVSTADGRDRRPRARRAARPGGPARRRRLRWRPSIGIGALSEQHGAGPIDDAIAIAAGWRAAGPDPPPAAAIGLTADGVVEIDLARDGPHALIAGTTGSGKSELLRTLVVSLAARSSPDHLTFVLVDYKGGSTFDACADLPHTVGVVTDLDDRLAERALVSLDAEIRRRERLLRAAGADDLAGVPRRARPRRRCPASSSWSTSSPPSPPSCPLPPGARRRRPARSQPRHPPRAGHPAPGRRRQRRHPRQHQPPPRPAPAGRRRRPRRRRRRRAGDVPAWHAGADDAAPRPGRDGRVPVGAQHRAGHAAGRRRAPRRRRRRSSSGGTDTELAVLVRSIRNAAALSDVGAAAPAVAAAAADPPRRPPDDARRARRRAGRAAARRRCAGARRTATWRCSAPRSGHDDGAAVADRRRLPRHRAVATHVYVIDARGDERLDELVALPHCGGVVRPARAASARRLLRRSAPSSTRAARQAAARVRRTSSSPSTACRRCAPRSTRHAARAATRRCSGSSPRVPASASSA